MNGWRWVPVREYFLYCNIPFKAQIGRWRPSYDQCGHLCIHGYVYFAGSHNRFERLRCSHFTLRSHHRFVRISSQTKREPGLIEYSPDKNIHLTRDETTVMQQRVDLDRGDAVYDPFTWAKFCEYLADWRIWAYAYILMGAIM